MSPDFILKSRHSVCSVHIAALVRICPMFSRNKQPRRRCAHWDEGYLDYKRGQMSANPIEAVRATQSVLVLQEGLCWKDETAGEVLLQEAFVLL